MSEGSEGGERSDAGRDRTPPDADPSWDLFGAFLAVMDAGSLSAAARTLGVTQPTVRRQIEKLESLLGVVLFTRATQGLVPTDVAEASLPHARAIAAQARAFVRTASGPLDAERGSVRLACSEVMGVEVLPAMLAGLSECHPGLQIELVMSNRNADLRRRDADLAVRMVRPTQEGLRARKVGAVEIGLFASEPYLARRSAPTALEALRGHALIGGDQDSAVLDALAGAGLRISRRALAFRSDSDLAQLAALRAGFGIGACQLPLARHSPGLLRVLPDLRFELEVWLVMHEDLRAARRVRLVFEHLGETLAAYLGATPSSDRASGECPDQTD